MKHRNRIALSRSDRLFTVVNTLFLTFVLAVIAYPLLIIVSNSFSDAQAVMAGKVWLLPVGFNLNGYAAVFRNAVSYTHLDVS